MEPQNSTIPQLRLQVRRPDAVATEGAYVLYWMIAQRRAQWNFALDRAVEWAQALGKPLLVLEALRCDYPWACDRFHAFVSQGMAVNAQAFDRTSVAYYPYIEPEVGAGCGLLESLAQQAAVVVTDDFPCFFLPKIVESAAARLSVRFEWVDSNGLLPLRATDRVFSRAVDFRRFLQKTLPAHLGDFPRAEPLRDPRLGALDHLPSGITRQWPMAHLGGSGLSAGELARLPIDHLVTPVDYRGGSDAAQATLQRFLDQRLGRYGEGRNDVKERVTTELSPYLHFGHISAHQVFVELTRQERWNPSQLFHRATASRSGWWGMSEAAEAFVDQLITWRELGYNMSSQWPNYDRYESLPAWARTTLEVHQQDPREYLYTLDEFESAGTHDELWNAAQRELVTTGRIHNYLRMLWGKKILEWTPTPRDALAVMIGLNNKYAVDGRNPNSYSGIFWCLGRYDRAWGPERPIFGKIRFMSSDSTRRKLDAKAYIAKFGPGEQTSLWS